MIPMEEIAVRFTYHPPGWDQQEKYEEIRKEAMALATTFNKLCPDCREKYLALTALEESVTWATAAIARREK